MPSAIEMLREDHKKVQDLFREFEQADSSSQRKRIVDTALKELAVHASLEEELFYPALRDGMAEEIIDKAEEEHHVVELLIKELGRMKPQDERYAAKFRVLAENVKHHIQEEESEVLPQAENIVEVENLGEQMWSMKQEFEKKMQGPAARLLGKAMRRKIATSARRAGRDGAGAARQRRAG